MPVPQITLTPAEPLADEVLTPNAAAAFLGTTRANVAKLLAAGYLQDLSMSSLKPVRLADFVSAGKTLPLVQTAPAEVAVETPDWRKWWGDAPTLSDEDWLDAQCGDWTGAGAGRVVNTGYLLVGLGGIITGVTKVITAVPSGDPRKARFKLKLLVRLTGDLRSAATSCPDEASAEDRMFARSLVGRRYEPRAGGSVMWL